MAGDATPAIRITPAMRQAFARHAPGTLARRNDAYLLGIAIDVAQWLLVGSLGLLGLYHWGWTAADMLLVFVAGIAAAVAIDAVKWVFARRAMLADHQTMLDDRLVWAMLDAKAAGRDEIPADRLAPRPLGQSLVLDLVLGALALWILAANDAVPALTAEGWAGLATGVRIALLLVLGAPLLALLTTALAHRRAQRGYDDLEFRAGGRGIGLLALAVAIAFFTDAEAGARGVMLFVHWATVVLGVVSILGVWLMLRERNRLRAHLAAR